MPIRVTPNIIMYHILWMCVFWFSVFSEDNFNQFQKTRVPKNQFAFYVYMNGRFVVWNVYIDKKANNFFYGVLSDFQLKLL